jgi:hypothetical protein
MSARSCSLARSVFFIRQIQIRERIMNGGQGAGQTGGLAQVAQGQIRPPSKQAAEVLTVPVKNLGLTPGEVMARSDVASATALLEQLLDCAQGNPKAMGDFGSGAFVGIVSSQYPFAQIQGQGLHAPTLPPASQYGYSFI